MNKLRIVSPAKNFALNKYLYHQNHHPTIKSSTHFQKGLCSSELGLDTSQVERGVSSTNTVLKIDTSSALETSVRPMTVVMMRMDTESASFLNESKET